MGLGGTMTTQGVPDGYKNITVHVAPVRPAELVAITIQRKMQTS
ncbi:hypothetical protein AIOL_004442 [Candidatus Rhodobacter oscarellae]|uniref:Uncharacterized protein n=1 Tax=Candidatus Rhodobacter oscarellae TaxID=1675527 RepID=A0A0J9E9J8_9RHOB|nr:hypothetical protein AIOL_004442 [Candidatus Rhodobacter lobularis]